MEKYIVVTTVGLKNMEKYIVVASGGLKNMEKYIVVTSGGLKNMEKFIVVTSGGLKNMKKSFVLTSGGLKSMQKYIVVTSGGLKNVEKYIVVTSDASRVVLDPLHRRAQILVHMVQPMLLVHLLPKVVARLKPSHFLNDTWCCPSWNFIPRSALFIIASGTGFLRTSANRSLVPTFLILKILWVTRSCT